MNINLSGSKKKKNVYYIYPLLFLVNKDCNLFYHLTKNYLFYLFIKIVAER